MTSRRSTPTTVPWRTSPQEWTPLPHQEKALKRMLKNAVLGLFMDPGLGKTGTTLALIKILLKQKLIGKTLVIAPLRVATGTWPAEIQKWSDFNHLRFAILHGPKKDEALQSDADIYLINPEGLEWLIKPEKVRRGKKTSVRVDVRAFKRLGFDVLVVDELTKFKNYSSLRFKMMKQILATFARRYGLTGSPADNGLMDLFGQMYMLDEGRSLGRFITHYRQEYFTEDFNGFSYSLLPDAEKRIYKAIAPVSMRMEADDYLKLPELIINELWLDLPPEARAVYDAVDKELMALLDNGQSITAKNSGVALNKCRQLASGAIYAEDALGFPAKVKRGGKREWYLVDDTKTEALKELVEELQGQPLMVVYEYRHELERLKTALKEQLGHEVPHLGSGVSIKAGNELAVRWNVGEVPVLLVHPASVAHGLNLQGAANHIAWYTPTWDNELFNQLIARLRRQGNKHDRVFVHMLLARNTVDEAVMATIKRKGGGAADFTKALRERPRRRR